MYNSLIGLYNYRTDIFDDITLYEKIDKTQTINRILSYAGEFELLHANPDFLKYQINLWFTTNMYRFKTLAETMFFVYNPIENYARTEEVSRETSRNSNGTISGNSTGTGTNEKQIAGFDNNKYVNSEYVENGEKTNSNSASNSEETENEHYELRNHGNIGVTTTQQMIEQERKIANFNIYDYIAVEFANEFCIQIY